MHQTLPTLFCLTVAITAAAGCIPHETGFPEVASSTEFMSADSCETCHPQHAREWRGSVMHYSAASPVFNAFEATIQRLSNGAVAPNGENASFCSECHAPLSKARNEAAPFVNAESVRPLVESISESSQEGITCDFCHRVTGPDMQGSLEQDGIANFSLFFSPGETKIGPIANATGNRFHKSTNSSYISSSDFCGSCHDVRIPKPDLMTGEPFQRLENLFTEWKNSPYNSTNNRYGRVVRCQDCHMSLYPMAEPGTFPQMFIAEDDSLLTMRQHALHAFTAVSKPLVDDSRFPNVDTDARDDLGYPLGQEQRREMLLRASVRMTLDQTPTQVSRAGGMLPVRVTLENVGAGHNVPSGFSQEREVWVHLVVRDSLGIIYESGYLRDKPHPELGEDRPDGRLDDEDLDHRHFDIDMATFETRYSPGPDQDMRPFGINLGLVNFQNNFLRRMPDGSFVPTLNPMHADHMDNSRSLPPLQPRTFAYDVPIPARGISGPVMVEARLNYRAFPPEFLRFLAEREHLFGEELVDRNTIVPMAEAATAMQVF